MMPTHSHSPIEEERPRCRPQIRRLRLVETCSAERVRTIEHAVFVKRFWMKICHVCNNNCLFCLDGERVASKRFEPLEALETQMKEAAESSYERLVISGGEPTIHPHFVQIVEAAGRFGFSQIQVITNGRMLSYSRFARAAVDAGLSEVTFSVHGHTPDLHDLLTGVKGSFAQTIRGVQNIQSMGKCVVNADIVVNKQNHRHIADIIDSFSSLGVYEFDLLHVVPFGHAFHNKGSMFFDISEAYGDLQRAFSFSRRQDATFHIWTNRFPPAYLENYEELIQDPHKLYDEVRGRIDELEDVFRGKQMRCYSERCSLCFMNAFCRKLSFYANVIRGRETPDEVETAELDDAFCDFIASVGSVKTVRVPFSEATKRTLETNDAIQEKMLRVELLCGGVDNVCRMDGCRSETATVAYEVEEMSEAVLEAPFWRRPSARLIIPVNSHNASFILSHVKRLSVFQEWLEFRIPSFAQLSVAKRHYSKLGDVLGQFNSTTYSYHNCAPCLAGGGIFDPRRRVILEPMVDPGNVDVKRLLDDFIVHDYFVQRRTCNVCVHRDRCRGMHINFIRVFGFRALTPILREV